MATEDNAAADPNQMMSTTEVAKICGVSNDKVLAWIADGELVAYNLGSGRRVFYKIKRADLDAFLDRKRVQPVQEVPKRRRRLRFWEKTPTPTPTHPETLRSREAYAKRIRDQG